jgi:hypothetical protein
MSTPRILDYASTPLPDTWFRRVVIALAAGIVTFLNWNLTMCMCGYQSTISLPGNLLGMGLSLWAFAVTSRLWTARIVAACALIFCVLILAMNIHNVLWSGHEPLLP